MQGHSDQKALGDIDADVAVLGEIEAHDQRPDRDTTSTPRASARCGIKFVQIAMNARMCSPRQFESAMMSTSDSLDTTPG